MITCKYTVTYREAHAAPRECGADRSIDIRIGDRLVPMCSSHAGLLIDTFRKLEEAARPVTKLVREIEHLTIKGRVKPEDIVLWQTTSNIPERPGVRLTAANVLAIAGALADVDKIKSDMDA